MLCAGHFLRLLLKTWSAGPFAFWSAGKSREDLWSSKRVEEFCLLHLLSRQIEQARPISEALLREASVVEVQKCLRRKYVMVRIEKDCSDSEEFQQLRAFADWQTLTRAQRAFPLFTKLTEISGTLRRSKAGAVTRSTAWYVSPGCCCRYTYGEASVPLRIKCAAVEGHIVVPSGPWSARTAGLARLPVTAR